MAESCPPLFSSPDKDYHIWERGSTNAEEIASKRFWAPESRKADLCEFFKAWWKDYPEPGVGLDAQ